MHRSKTMRLTWRAGLALVAGTGVLLSNSCSTTDPPVVAPLQIQGAAYVGDKTCADCHADITRAFPASPHARLHLDHGQSAGRFSCESCHGPGGKHVTRGGQGGPDKFIINPGKDPQACFECHLEVRAEFHFPRHHPVLEGNLNCVQCHDPHGLDIMKPAGGLAMARLNQNCAQCHREQTRPFVYEHPALREGCTVCHQPHGSINAQLLTEPDSNLCLRCHAQVPGPGASGRIFIGGRDHTSSLAFGSCWTAGCHTAVHGSNVQPTLIKTTPGLGEDVHLDTGKAWVDFGLTLPDWPQLVLGYELDYQQGNEATTGWSDVGNNRNTARNLAPASERRNEDLHILKLDLDDDFKGVSVADQFRGQFYHLSTGDTNVAFGPIPQSISEGTTYFQGANTLRLEKQLNDSTFVSAGYLYSKLNADSSFSMTAPSLLQLTDLPRITLAQESHVGNLNGLLGPFDGLVISTGAQAEWTRQEGFGPGTFDQETPPPPFTSTIIPFNVASDYDDTSLQENGALRYSKIPFTSLFAEARLEQENIGQSDQFSSSQDILGKAVFSQHTAFSSQSDDLRVGFSTSPWRIVSFSAHYRRSENDSQYDSDPLVQPVMTAYPTFIRSLDLLTHEVEAKLVLHPSPRFKTTLSYQYHHDEYDLSTSPYVTFGSVISPGGQLIAGQDHTHDFSLGIALTPTPRLFLSSTVSYETSGVVTAADGSPAVAPDQGDLYTVLADGTCVLSQTTDLFAGYAFSEANYGQDNFSSGLPLGIQYQRHSAQVGLTRRFGSHVSAKLQYRFDYYAEPSSGGAANYRAHSIFGVLSFQIW